MTLNIRSSSDGESIDRFSEITGLDHDSVLGGVGRKLERFLESLYEDATLPRDTSFVEKCSAILFIQALDVDTTGSARLAPGTKGDLKEIVADFLMGWLFTGGIERDLWIERVYSGIDLVKSDWVVCVQPGTIYVVWCVCV